MKRTVSLAHAQPIASINITPLIDVMLVLLIMLIITIPSSLHKLPVDLPNGTPGTMADTPPHLLDISASGALSWDGRSISETELPGLLASAVAGGGVLRVKTDELARYDRFHEVMAKVRSAGVTRLGFVGNEAMRF